MSHQQDAVDRFLHRAEMDMHWIPIFAETGTGKTLMALKIIEECHAMGRRKFLVVCPKALIEMWGDEAIKWQLPLRVQLFDSDSVAERKKLLKKPFDVLVVNYDSVRLMEAELIAQGFEVAIYDELHKIKNRDAKSTLAVRRLSIAITKRSGFVVGLTGTPIANNPLDLWSEFDVLDPHFNYIDHPLGYGSFASFEAQVATKRAHPKVPGLMIYTFPDANLVELKKRVAKHAYQVAKKDCLDLPSQTFTRVPLTLLPEQRRVYDALVADSVAYVNERKSIPIPGIQSMADYVHEWVMRKPEKRKQVLETDRVSVTLQTVLLLRLQQVASGHVKTDDGVVKTLASAKNEYLKEKLPSWTDLEGDNKLVIISRFRHDIAAAAELCDKLKIGYLTLTGDNSKHAQRLATQFQTDPRIRVFIGQVQAASTGLTLTAANRMCFYSNSYNYVDRKQSEDRIHRISQTRPVEYHDLMGRGTIDEYVLARLLNKKKIAVKTTQDLIKIFQNPSGVADEVTESYDATEEDLDDDILDLW
jgi:SWI/SNF-related matrix-associated actin-dependent regulator 1 of chromatin subfamily A